MTTSKGGRPAEKGKEPERIGCVIPKKLFDRIEAGRAIHGTPRAVVIQRALEKYCEEMGW